jgi:hypothetical protein
MALSDDPRTDPFNFLNQLNQNSANTTAFVTQSAAKRRSLMNRAGGGNGGYSGGPTSAPSGDIQSYAKSRLDQLGWGNQWDAFNRLVTQESSWNPNAVNKSSGAWGLAQILPSAHRDIRPGSLNADQQIDWMLNYIKGRYGNPSNAWSFHLKNNWY